jgi:FixJ family two-component response regulator
VATRAEGYCSAERILSVDGLSKSACIVTDVEMPAMNGLGLLRYIRSVNSPAPVVTITSEAFYLERGAIGFFRKPVDGDALVDLIKSVC